MTYTKSSSWRRRLSVLLGISLASFTPVALSQPVSASPQSVKATSEFDPPLKLAAAPTKKFRAFRTEWVPGFPITGSTPAPVVVAITMPQTTSGTSFTIMNPGDATLNYGYSSFRNVTSVAFTSSVVGAQRALRTIAINAGEAGKVTLAVSITLDETDMVYEPVKSAYYKYIPIAGIRWTEALTFASNLTFRGVKGSLAAIETAEENDFISANISGARNVWIGGTDRDNEGEFKWVSGPSAGSTFWKARCAGNSSGSADSCTGANNVVTGGQSNGVYKDGVIDNPLVNTFSSWDLSTKEPNNWGGLNQAQGGENFVATNWNGTSGLWNDLPDSTPSISGYLVEYPAEAGKPFVGVLRTSTSFDITEETSAYAPTNVKVTPTGTPGEYTVTWGEPKAFQTKFFASLQTRASAARARTNFRSYFITKSSQYKGDYIGCVVTIRQTRSCTISGFSQQVEPVISVVARYERHPGQNPRAKRTPGQTTFGAFGKSSASTAPEFVKFAGRRNASLTNQSAITVEASGLAPNAAWTLKNSANGRTVASGTTNASGAITAVRRTLPAITRSSGSSEWWQVKLELSYVDVTGQNRVQPYTLLLDAYTLSWSSGPKEYVVFREITPTRSYQFLSSRSWRDTKSYEAFTVSNWPES